MIVKSTSCIHISR